MTKIIEGWFQPACLIHTCTICKDVAQVIIQANVCYTCVLMHLQSGPHMFVWLDNVRNRWWIYLNLGQNFEFCSHHQRMFKNKRSNNHAIACPFVNKFRLILLLLYIRSMQQFSCLQTIFGDTQTFTVKHLAIIYTCVYTHTHIYIYEKYVYIYIYIYSIYVCVCIYMYIGL